MGPGLDLLLLYLMFWTLYEIISPCIIFVGCDRMYVCCIFGLFASGTSRLLEWFFPSRPDPVGFLLLYHMILGLILKHWSV